MSSPPPTASAPAVRRGPPPPVSWRSWPLEEGGASAWWLSIVAVGVIVAVGLSTGSAQRTLVACAVLGLAAWRFFVPTHYELGAQGILQEVLGRQRRIPWRTFESAELCREGVFLRPANGGWFSPHGLYLPWSSRRSEVLAQIEYYLHHARHQERHFGFELDK
ncbi:MAG TPA: hypothetical protein VHC19_06080 [Pirellulales bacterium]|nr:hypothetical protein [Pirellulales bacterium]